MKIALISDTHGQHQECEITKCDMLIHCGDVSKRGKMDQIIDFLGWFVKQPAKHLVFVAGNHDFLFETDPSLTKSILTDFGFNELDTDRYYLQDSMITIEGLKIYGSPWQPNFCNWAFNLPRGEALARKWAMIPENLDILITHGPPKGLGDRVETGEEVGCGDLLERIKVIHPTYSCFGHIHEAYGIYKLGGLKTTFMNCSLLNERYKLTNKPFIIEV